MNRTLLVHAAELYTLLLEGGLALAPTQTGYGLVGMKSDAVRRIYELKGRPTEKPCVTVGSMEILGEVARDVPASSRTWLAGAVRRWPMAVIARTQPESALLRSFEPFVASQCTKADTIATFFGVGDLISRAAELARMDGRLIVGSSANLAGTGNNYTLDDVPTSMRAAVDRVFDYGPTRFSSDAKLASTILDLTRGTFQRKGVCFEEIEASWTAHQRNGAQPGVPGPAA